MLGTSVTNNNSESSDETNTLYDTINTIEARWKEYEDRDPLCKDYVYHMIDHGVNGLEHICCLWNDDKGNYDEIAHPGDCDGPIFAYAHHNIWTLLNIIKTMRSEISNK